MNDEYITRHEAEQCIVKLVSRESPAVNHVLAKAIDEINSIPAADVVEVVRCGECNHYKKRYWENGRCYGTFCDIWNRDHGKTFFCGSGINREKKHE